MMRKITSTIDTAAGNKTGRSRDRIATRESIINAVGTLLARDGFMALGINAVAKEAGIDKVLIYRYFGGMPELLRAFGESEEFWPSASEMLGDDIDALMSMSLTESVPLVLINFTQALKRRPVTLQIMAWEMVDQNELTEVLKNVREDMSIRIFNEFAKKLADADAHMDADMGAITTLLSAAVSYLLLRSRDTEFFNTVNIRSEKGWERLERAIVTICRQCLARENKG